MNRVVVTRSAFRAGVVTLGLLWLLASSTPAAAQGHADAAELKKQMAEISRLMRESERLLLEMTMIDRLVEQQLRVVSELEKLEPPREDQPAGSADGARQERTEQQKLEEQAKRAELQNKQAELRRKLEELFRSQDAASRQSVESLEKLLRNLPSGGMGSGMGDGPPERKPSGSPQDDDAKNKEQKQNESKAGEEKPDQKPGENKRSKEEQKREEEKKNEQSRLAHMDAWMARLPPAQLERISRNDFSGFPARYRRLLREYTQLRAKQEAEKEREER